MLPPSFESWTSSLRGRRVDRYVIRLRLSDLVALAWWQGTVSLHLLSVYGSSVSNIQAVPQARCAKHLHSTLFEQLLANQQGQWQCCSSSGDSSSTDQLFLPELYVSVVNNPHARESVWSWIPNKCLRVSWSIYIYVVSILQRCTCPWINFHGCNDELRNCALPSRVGGVEGELVSLH